MQLNRRSKSLEQVKLQELFLLIQTLLIAYQNQIDLFKVKVIFLYYQILLKKVSKRKGIKQIVIIQINTYLVF